MGRPNRYSPEVRERAVRLVFEHEDQHDSQWAAIRSVADKIGCSSETLRHWVRRAERDQGRRPGLTTDERARLKAQEREIRELRRANEILRKASAYFAQAELDRRARSCPTNSFTVDGTQLEAWASLKSRAFCFPYAPVVIKALVGGGVPGGSIGMHYRLAASRSTAGGTDGPSSAGLANRRLRGCAVHQRPEPRRHPRLPGRRRAAAITHEPANPVLGNRQK